MDFIITEWGVNPEVLLAHTVANSGENHEQKVPGLRLVIKLENYLCVWHPSVAVERKKDLEGEKK